MEAKLAKAKRLIEEAEARGTSRRIGIVTHTKEHYAGEDATMGMDFVRFMATKKKAAEGTVYLRPVLKTDSGRAGLGMDPNFQTSKSKYGHEDVLWKVDHDVEDGTVVIYTVKTFGREERRAMSVKIIY